MKLEDTKDLMISEDYKERFIAEYVQTKIRLDRLHKILDAWYNNKLPGCFVPTCPMPLLESQYEAMKNYERVLRTRAELEDIELPIITEV